MLHNLCSYLRIKFPFSNTLNSFNILKLDIASGLIKIPFSNLDTQDSSNETRELPLYTIVKIHLKVNQCKF